jgi:hypothetical protein
MDWMQLQASVIQNVNSTRPVTTTLGKWVEATKVSTISCDKRHRPALMPHGVFDGGRSSHHLVMESGVIQFDIDRKHNAGLDVEQVKAKAAEVEDIVFCAKSAVNGCYGFAIRRGDQDEQLDRIEAALGVVLDRCNSRSMAALRFASVDRFPYCMK